MAASLNSDGLVVRRSARAAMVASGDSLRADWPDRTGSAKVPAAKRVSAWRRLKESSVFGSDFMSEPHSKTVSGAWSILLSSHSARPLTSFRLSATASAICQGKMLALTDLLSSIFVRLKMVSGTALASPRVKQNSPACSQLQLPTAYFITRSLRVFLALYTSHRRV